MSAINAFEDHHINDIPLEDMYYLFVDTETTGVPNNRYSDWSQCRLIQLGLLVKNRNLEVMHEECITLAYDGTNSSSPESTAIHGITDEERLNATPGIDACKQFLRLGMKCDVLVSHGNAFDFGVIFRECLLYNLDISCLIGKTVVNTKQSEHYRGFRENLQQTVQRINPEWTYNTDDNTNHAHNALYDAHLCAELFRHSHHPKLYQSVQSLIEYLNFCKYSADIDELRAKVEEATYYDQRYSNEEEIISDSLEIDSFDDYSSNCSYKDNMCSGYMTMEDYLRCPYRCSTDLYHHHAPEDYAEFP